MYTVFHFDKIKDKTHMTNTNRHNNRIIAEDISHNEDIFSNVDLSLSHHNVHIVECTDLQDSIMRRIEATNVKVRKSGEKNKNGSVLAITFMMSATPEFFLKLSQSDFNRWLDTNRKFMEDEFGKDNIIQMVCHNDEMTPHIHAIITPILQKENGEHSLSSFHFIGQPYKCREYQTKYAEAIQSAGFNLERGEEGSQSAHVGKKEYTRAEKRAGKKKIDISTDIEIASFESKAGMLSNNKDLLKQADQKIRDLIGIIKNLENSHNGMVLERELDKEKYRKAPVEFKRYSEKKKEFLLVIKKMAKDSDFARVVGNKLAGFEEKKPDTESEEIFGELMKELGRHAKVEKKKTFNYVLMAENQLEETAKTIGAELLRKGAKGYNLYGILAKSELFVEQKQESSPDGVEDGYTAVFKHTDTDTDYHIDRKLNVFYCTKNGSQGNAYDFFKDFLELDTLEKVFNKIPDLADKMADPKTGLLVSTQKADSIGNPAPIRNPALILYLQNSHIDLEIAEEHLTENLFDLDGNVSIGLYYRDESGNARIFNKFLDMTLDTQTKPQKDITVIQREETSMKTPDNRQEVWLFESMMDFLAMETYNRKKGIETGNRKAILTNGLDKEQVLRITAGIPEKAKVVSFLPKNEKSGKLMEAIREKRADIKVANAKFEGETVLENLILSSVEKEKGKVKGKNRSRGFNFNL